jgi:hypothetical protein
MAGKFLKKNRLPLREKIIWIAAINANNMSIVNEQVEWSGRNQYCQLWQQATKSSGFVMGIRNKLYATATNGILQGWLSRNICSWVFSCLWISSEFGENSFELSWDKWYEPGRKIKRCLPTCWYYIQDLPMYAIFQLFYWKISLCTTTAKELPMLSDIRELFLLFIYPNIESELTRALDCTDVIDSLLFINLRGSCFEYSTAKSVT